MIKHRKLFTRIWYETRISTLITTSQYSTGSPNYSMSKKKNVKVILIGKEVKPSIFSNNMIIYVENPKDFIKKLIETINYFSKGQVIKSMHKSVAFIYASNEIEEESF